ncbi:hypothetical protein ACFPU0_09185 [Pseudomonas sp. GCM10022186]|uniref:hypothetical protein n=1 Tax=Pseudomonas sp. GCM10022186 TaxID=3252650 RepID=UPI0036131CDA
MSSFDISGARPERHRLDDAPASWRSRAGCTRQRTTPFLATFAPQASANAAARAVEFDFPTSIIEVLPNLLDAAEQRNAEDSPSGAARHSRLGLTG